MKDPKEGPAPAGRRADDSSLFSLDALKIKETATAAQARKTTEDSGLIDLRALAALERQGENQKSPLDVASVVAPADIFGASPGTPLIAPPPASAVAAPPPGMVAEGPKKNTGIIIGGAVVAVAAAVGIFMLTRGPDAAPAAPTSAPTATAAPVVTQAAEPASPEPSVAAVVPGQRPTTPTATATVDPAGAAPAPPKPVVKGPMPKAAPKEPPAAPAPPPKPVDTCDLACQMQRAVNKKK